MFLVEDKARSEQSSVAPTKEAPPVPAAGGKWQHFPNSHISHHGQACCDIAHEWLRAFDLAQLNGGDLLSGPRWIREHSAWGPSAWPIHWCEAVDRPVVDCGVHAALAHDVFTARGVSALRVQLIQRYSDDSAASWRENWSKENVSDHWLDGDAIYHEAIAIFVGEDEVKLWDGSAAAWIEPRQRGGYGGLQALRIERNPAITVESVCWGRRRLKLDQWVPI